MPNWFKNLKIKNKTLLGNGIVVILLLSFTLTIYFFVKQLLETTKWVTHTEEVINKGNELMVELLNMETGERGFLLTGKPQFLEPYEKALKTFNKRLNTTLELVSDNPTQIKNLKNIEILAERWLKEAAKKEISLRKDAAEGTAYFEELQTLLSQGEGKSIVDNIRAVINKIELTFNDINNARGVFLALSIAKDMVDQETGQRGFLITGKEEFLEPYKTGTESLNGNLKRLNELINNLSIKDNSLNNNFEELVSLTKKWKIRAAKPEIALRYEINEHKLTMKHINMLIESENGKNIMDELRVQIDNFINIEEELIKKRRLASSVAATNTVLLVVVGSVIGIMIVFGLGWIISNSISKPLKRFINLADAIAKGDMTKKLDIVSEDEIGELAQAFKEMATGLTISRKSLQDQNWLKSNLAETLSNVQKTRKLEDIAEITIRMLCPLLGSPSGAIYFSEGVSIERKKEEEVSLALYGTYGYKPSNGTQIRFGSGEGVVGQCALEKNQIFLNLTSPEQNTVNTKAGIKEPSYLMLTPIIFEQKLLGVIQIFAYNELSDIKKNLVNQLSGQIGAIINSVNFTLDVEALLEQSRKYRDKLQNSKEDLEKKAVELEKANRYKSEFLASMSHEIRTPMNAIIGMADLLVETKLTEEQKKYVNTYRYAGENLLSIINDILDLSKIESGQMKLEKIDFDLQELIERTSEIMAIPADEKGLELVNQCIVDVSYPFVSDPARLRQVIINLVGNAIKFTKNGEVVIGVESREITENEADLLFYVKDTGIGIPKDKQEAIFGSFSQADSSTTRKYGGSGLGLHISKLVVELMGGKIWVESEEGNGSTFYFTLKLAIDKQSVRKVETVMELNGLRVLIVDDNRTNRMILNKTLSNWGASTKEVVDGESCLDELKKARESGQPYDLILMDYMMPGMNGLEVTEKIKDNKKVSSPIIIMTSSIGSAFDSNKYKKIGLDGYIHKPVKQSELQSTINTVLGKAEVAKEKKDVTVKTTDDGRPKKILLVEDNMDNRNLIIAYLKKKPHGIEIAENGQIAVDMFKTRSYDLVLMDIEMPVMDGCTATKSIRQWEKENGLDPTPIVALTAHALKEHEEKSKEAGCDGHITKPIKKATILETIQQFSK